MEKKKINSLFVNPNLTIKQAMQILDESAQKILFVLDDKSRLVGTVTDGDIRRAIIHGCQFTNKIELLMNRNYSFLKWRQTSLIDEAKSLMINKEIEQVPVIDENGIIVDVILWMDILNGKPSLERIKLHTNYVVIMAGGKGTRMDPFTKIFPKPLIPIGNKTVIELIMDRFFASRFNKFILTLNYKKEFIKTYIQENSTPYSIEWVEEPDFLGTAGSLSLLRDKLRETFIVANCDSLLEIDISDMLSWHYEHKALMTVLGCYNEVKIHFGVLEIGNGKLLRILEKPTHDIIVNTGIYVMDPRVLDYIPDSEVVNMDVLIDSLLKADENVTVFPIHSGWYDLGRWEQYKQVLRDYEF